MHKFCLTIICLCMMILPANAEPVLIPHENQNDQSAKFILALALQEKLQSNPIEYYPAINQKLQPKDVKYTQSNKAEIITAYSGNLPKPVQKP